MIYMNKPECRTNPYGTNFWFLNDKLHREDGPAVEIPDGTKFWYLNDKEVHPETLVDLWLERGVFCWLDETTETLNFGEKNLNLHPLFSNDPPA